MDISDPSPSCSTGVAKTPSGPVQAEHFDASKRSVELTCYDCNSQLYFRTAHTRMICGVSTPVRACFCHMPRPGEAEHTGCRGGGEGTLHRAAKHKIQMNPTMQFITNCEQCQTVVQIEVNPSPCNTQVVLECAFKQYRLDVGFVDAQSSAVVGCIEVYASHHLSMDKITALTDANLAWCEVDANDVLDADLTQPVRVIGCGLPNFLCAPCRDTAERRAHEQQVEARKSAITKFHREAESWKELAKTMEIRVNDERKAIVNKLVQLLSEENLTFFKVSTTKKVGEFEFFPEPKRTKQNVSKAQIESVAASIPHTKFIIPFGKYASNTLQDVFDTDFGYIVWLAGFERRRVDGENRPTPARTPHTYERLRSLARELIQGFCFSCGASVQGPKWKTWCYECYSNPVFR